MLDRQHDALNAAGVDRIFEDKITGMKFERRGLDALLDYARAGDSMIIESLNRLGRSLSEIVRTADELLKRGIVLRSLREGIDYSTPTGRMVAGIFGALAEYERVLTYERAAEARAAARARGKQTGRPRALTRAQLRQARQLRAAGESRANIVHTLGCARSTLYRSLADEQAAPA